MDRPVRRKWIKSGTKDSDNIINIKDLVDPITSDKQVSGIEKVIYELNGNTIENMGSSADKSVKLGELKKQLSLTEGRILLPFVRTIM